MIFKLKYKKNRINNRMNRQLKLKQTNKKMNSNLQRTTSKSNN